MVKLAPSQRNATIGKPDATFLRQATITNVNIRLLRKCAPFVRMRSDIAQTPSQTLHYCAIELITQHCCH
jgi:hypothetical protein